LYLEKTERSIVTARMLPILFLSLVISFITTPAHSQDGWSVLRVGDDSAFIFRDEFGVPHILSEDSGTLFEAFGYVVAQDRLTQLEISRRQARGRLAEVLGPDALMSDIEARREGYTGEEIAGQYNGLDPETRMLIEAYARGVNRWIDEVKADRGSKLPRELWELGILDPEPWTVYDSVAVGIAGARHFGQRGGYELKNLKELEELGRDAFEEKYPFNDPASPTTIALNNRRDDSLLKSSLPLATADLSPAGEYQDSQDSQDDYVLPASLPGLPAKLGSYVVAVSRERSASGRAMLLGCPQMGSAGPQPGYEVDLHGGGFDVGGMTFPGVPAVLIGYNRHIAWTVTSGNSDNMDVFVEELNPKNPEEYRFNGEYRPFETREEVFGVRGAGQVREEIYRTVHGPVFRWDESKKLAYSKKRTFWGEEPRVFESFLRIDRAGSIEECAGAVEAISLSFNLFCAASDGRIGFWHAGKYRVPAPGVDTRLPASGTGDEEWQGFVPWNELPHVIDPPDGLLVNWNNKPSRDWDNGDNMPWVGGHRVSYIEGLFADRQKITPDDLRAVPEGIDSHGTYQQVVELVSGSPVVSNILPPGESGFIDKSGMSGPHYVDQKEIFDTWRFKPGYFLGGDTDGDGVADREEARKGTNPFVRD
jgi:penicillin amidase